MIECNNDIINIIFRILETFFSNRPDENVLLMVNYLFIEIHIGYNNFYDRWFRSYALRVGYYLFCSVFNLKFSW
jgi:hypothetical protein